MLDVLAECNWWPDLHGVVVGVIVVDAISFLDLNGSSIFNADLAVGRTTAGR